MTEPGRVVVLGGTFDPIHLGHLAAAEQARDLAGADEAWLIPANTPPHRGATMASSADRLDLVRAAAAGRPRMRVLDLELRRPGPSYTADTLAELAAGHPGTEIWFALGTDAARDMATWHRREEVLESGRFLLLNRGGVGEVDAEEAALLGFHPERTRIVHIDSPPISATEVRRRAALGLPTDGLVPPAVARLIAERGLYRAVAGSGPPWDNRAG
ncbi:MAG TPA: nicotinate (nicotinamide) nucleotide adenylyltransferase [Candidatus Dormibacteraeota bacterium]|nr:nicotinate (nicotinamide) nucleotide adenylyltransferase [Candidatus Dormibacteraeota bacterium]